MIGERLVDGELVDRFLKSEGYRPELLAAQLEICMSSLWKLVKTGQLPKRRRAQMLQKLAALMGKQAEDLLLPVENNEKTA